MSAAWYIVAEEPAVQEQLPVVNGKSIGKHWDHLGVIAQENGQPRIETYFSQPKDEALSALADDFGIDLEGAEAAAVPEEAWYAPEEGVRYVEKLIELVGGDSGIAEKTRQELLADLAEYRAAFEVLQRHSCRWHLAVDF